MATNDFLEAETRERPRVAIAAILAALLTLASPVILQVAIGGEKPDNQLTAAMMQGEHGTAMLTSATVSLLGLLALIYPLDFLLRAARSRYPDLPAYTRPLLLVGGLGFAAFTGWLQIYAASRLSHFATEGTQTWEELTDVGGYGVLRYVGLATYFAFAVGFIMVVLNAMRVGLLTRFMGYLGAFSAILFVLPVPLLPLPVVQVYWLAGLAWLLLAIGKEREPPAWRSTEPVPWPTSAEVRERRVRAAEASRGGGGAEPAAVESYEADAGPSPATSKRKRKKRR